MLVAIIRSCCVKMVVAIIRLCCVELVVAIIRSCCQQQYNTWILYSNMFNIQVKAYRVQCYLSCGAFLACYSRSQIKSFYVQFHSKVSKMVWNFYHRSIVHAFVRFPDGQSTWTFRTISSYVQCCMGFTHMWQVVMQVSEINLYLSCSLTLPSNSLLSYFDPHAATFFLALSIPTVLFSSPVSRSYL